MRKTPLKILALCPVLTLGLLCLCASQAHALSPSDLVVVYNLNVQASKGVAEHYAEKRGVPPCNLVGVDVTTSEKISRSDYERSLIPPVRAIVEKLRDGGKDPAILLVYGIPLVVKGPKGKKPDKDFKALTTRKVEEHKELVLALINELDHLTGKTDSDPGPSDRFKKRYKTQDILKRAGASFSRGLEYLEESRPGKDYQEARLRVYSLLIRLAGTSTAAKAFLGSMSDEEQKNRELLQGQELLKWDAVLRGEMSKRSFLGIEPEEALETATIVRFADGVLGELKFWDELERRCKDGKTSASVDSELTLVMAGPYQLAEWLPNPFHARYEGIPFVEEIRKNTVRVCRLDGPTPESAKRLVDDAVETEKVGLKGICYIDARGLKGDDKDDTYAWYDQHLSNLYEIIKDKASMEVVIEKGPALFPVGACPNAALYCGWYSLGNYVDAFTWQKGAVGFHVASGEASTLKKKGSNVWCKRMIEDGVAATLGPVQEPYLLSFPLPDHFFPLLMAGEIPLLEVYFQTTPYVSWRQILIGDPLYTPFKKNPAIRLPQKKETGVPHETKSE